MKMTPPQQLSVDDENVQDVLDEAAQHEQDQQLRVDDKNIQDVLDETAQPEQDQPPSCG